MLQLPWSLDVYQSAVSKRYIYEKSLRMSYDAREFYVLIASPENVGSERSISIDVI